MTTASMVPESQKGCILQQTFSERLARFGEAEAVVFDGDATTYRKLASLVAEWNRFIDENEVEPGTIVTLEGAYSPHTCAALIAMIDRAAIVVPMGDVPAAKREEFLRVAEVEAVVVVNNDGQRQFSRTGSHAEHDYYRRLRSERNPGLVLFSSGTTGQSKASVLNFDKILGRYKEGGKARRILSFLNLDHIGGVNTLLHTVCQGGTVVTVPDRTPDAVFSAIERHRVEVLPTTPTFLNMVLISGAHLRHDCSTLQLVTYGTEPMPQQTLLRLRRDLPEVRLKQTYGLSELGILPTKSRDNGSLWVKIGGSGFDYRIVDDILWIRSDMAMLGYLNAPAPFDADGYFNTQDVVETDGDWIRILGRRSEVINVGGEKVYPSEVESVILEVPNIAETTVSGRASHVTGMVVTATVWLAENEDANEVSRRVRQHCADRLEAFKVPAVVEVSTGARHSERYKKIRVKA